MGLTNVVTLVLSTSCKSSARVQLPRPIATGTKPGSRHPRLRSCRLRSNVSTLTDDSGPPVETTLKSTFATSWLYQVATLLQRDMQAHWRDPTYIVSKIALNIVAGLFIGFTFWQAKDSMQGTQNKLFVSTLTF